MYKSVQGKKNSIVLLFHDSKVSVLTELVGVTTTPPGPAGAFKVTVNTVDTCPNTPKVGPVNVAVVADTPDAS